MDGWAVAGERWHGLLATCKLRYTPTPPRSVGLSASAFTLCVARRLVAVPDGNGVLAKYAIGAALQELEAECGNLFLMTRFAAEPAAAMRELLWQPRTR